MALDAATIRIALQADASNMVSGFAAGSAAAGGFERSVVRSLTAVRQAYDKMSGSQKFIAAATVGGLALAGAMKAVVGPAIEFESAFAGVRKTVDGSPAQLEAIRDGLLDMSTVMPTSAEQLAAIAENAGQLGVAAPQVLQFTETIAMLGETTDLDFEEAAQSLARFLNITGEGPAAIGSVADVIVELGNNSATTESQIVNFSTRLASAFTVAGATSDEILAIAAAFSSMGIRAEAGGSALSKIITSISDAAIDGGEDLRTYADTAGLLPEEFAAIAEASPVEALLLVGDGLARLQAEGQTITPVLQALELGGLRTSEIFRLLALNTDDIRDSLALASLQMEDGGAAAEEYGKRIETTASRIEILKNRLNTLAVELGTPSLDLLAASADTAGDAIVGLVDLLTPLAAQVGTAFGNMADAAGTFYDVLGEPALMTAVAALGGVAVIAETVLGIFNALGPAGTIAAAGILAIAVNATAVRTAVAGLALSMQLTGAAATAMTAGSLALSAAWAALPVVAPIAVLASVGAEFNRARQSGEALARTMREDLNDALASGDYDRVTDSLRAMSDEQARLANVVGDSQTQIAGTGLAVRDFGDGLDVLVGFLPGVESEVLNNEAALRALEAQLDGLTVDQFTNRVERMANILGVSREQVIETAIELGLMEDLLDASPEAYQRFRDGLVDATAAQRAFADEIGVSAEALLDETATLGDFGDALGVTAGQLEFLASRIDDVDTEDLFDPDSQEEAFDAIQALVRAYTDLADQMGVTGQTYIDQLISVNDLAAAHGRLGEEISATAAVMDAAREANNLAADASLDFAAALEAVGESGEGLEQLGPAFESYQLAIAATSGTLDEFKGQQAEAALAIADAGAAAGLSGPQIAQLIQAYTVPDAQILQVIDLGENLTAASQEFTALQAQALQGILIELGIVDEASPVISSVLESLRVFATTEEEAYTAALAAADAGSLGLIADSSLEAETFEDTYQAELTAEAQQAIDTINATREALRNFTESEYIAFLLANGVPAEEAIRLTADFADTTWVTEFPAILSADGSGAIEVIELTAGTASDYAAADYGSILTANGSQAQEETAETRGIQEDYAGAPYQSALTADGTQAQRETAARKGQADDFAGTYTAELRANDLASGVIAAANRVLAGFRSKTITITTRRNTVNTVSADGGIDFSGVRTMADGALTGVSGELGGVPDRRQDASIYGPRMPWRSFFGEPETEGEAWIPLAASKRHRSVKIWEETGRLLGTMADGGIVGTFPRVSTAVPGAPDLIYLAPTVQVDASGIPGLDAQEVAELASAAVARELTKVGRKLSNTRILPR